MPVFPVNDNAAGVLPWQIVWLALIVPATEEEYIVKVLFTAWVVPHSFVTANDTVYVPGVV